MLKDLVSEPLAVEAFFAIVILVVFAFFLRTLRGVAARVSRRKALAEFVVGVDLYFKDEYEEAIEALRKVIERDPENSEARILLGDACREMGDVAEAHKHHWQVADVFGQDLPRNRLSLGTDLVAMGRAEEAIPHLCRVVEEDPEDRGAVELLLAANLMAGRFGESVALAKRLAETAPEAEEGAAKRRYATVRATAGRDLVDRGQVREGSQHLKAALKLNPSLIGPRLDLVRAAYLHTSRKSAERELVGHLREMSRLAEDGDVVFEPPDHLGGRESAAAAASEPDRLARLPPPSSGRALRPAPNGKELPAPESEGVPAPIAIVVRKGRELTAGVGNEVGPPIEAGPFVRVLLPREAAYQCQGCGRGELVFVETCPGCGRFGGLVPTDETAMAHVEGIREVFDEILENRAFIRSLVRRASIGDDDAARRLVAAGARAVPGVFRELMRVPDTAPLIRVLSDMGPDAAEAILDGYRRASSFSTKKLVREGMRAFRSLDRHVVRALAGMGPAVLPRIEPLVEEGERELRRIALDVMIRLGRAGRIEELRLAISTKELLERLNDCPIEELAAFLDDCPAEGHLVEQVLVDRTFTAEEALVAAMARPGNVGKLRRVLLRRGFSSNTYEALEVIWADVSVRTVVGDVVRSYGRAAADHLLKTYTTPTLPEEVREEALRLYVDLGSDEVDGLTERLTDGDPETERAVMRIVRAFGSKAVGGLVRAYGKTRLLQRVGVGRRRLVYRKTTLIRALGQIGTYEAIQGLRQLLDREGDAELRRRIEAVIKRLSGKEGGA